MALILFESYVLFFVLVSAASGFVAVPSTSLSSTPQHQPIRGVTKVAFYGPFKYLVHPVQYTSLLDLGSDRNEIDLQSDSSTYGRGDMHLSAVLDEGDVVAYQTGTWTVDGVEVGDGSPATIRYARVENIQIVWTHNCEHGVIRGVSLEADEQRKDFVSTGEQIEFGPEQLVARLVVEWDELEEKATAVVPFEESSLLT